MSTMKKGKTIGDNESQAAKDRNGFDTSIDMVTGGVLKEIYGSEGGTEVGRDDSETPGTTNKG